MGVLDIKAQNRGDGTAVAPDYWVRLAPRRQERRRNQLDMKSLCWVKRSICPITLRTPGLCSEA